MWCASPHLSRTRQRSWTAAKSGRLRHSHSYSPTFRLDIHRAGDPALWDSLQQGCPVSQRNPIRRIFPSFDGPAPPLGMRMYAVECAAYRFLHCPPRRHYCTYSVRRCIPDPTPWAAINSGVPHLTAVTAPRWLPSSDSREWGVTRYATGKSFVSR